MQETYYPINYQIGAELVYVYRGMKSVDLRNQEEIRTRGAQNEFERKVIEGEYNKVDQDHASDVSRFLDANRIERIARTPISSYTQAVKRLTRLGRELDLSTSDGVFAKSKIDATRAYLSALENKPLSAKRYIERGLGIEPGLNQGLTLVPNDDIEGFWNKKVAFEFSEVSDANLSRDQEGRKHLVKYIKSNGINPTKSAYREAEDRIMDALLKGLGIKEWPRYRVEFTDQDAYWMNWTDNDDLGFRLRINTNERVRDRFFKGVIGRMIVHEIGDHAMMGSKVAENIRFGKANPVEGIFTILGPEQHMEGRANTIAYFVPGLYKVLTPEERFAIDYRIYETLVNRNAHLMANGLTDNAPGDPVEYLMDNLPNMTLKKANTFVKDVTQDPRDQVYRLDYGYSYEYLKFAERLSPRQGLIGGKADIDRRPLFIVEGYEHPRTFAQTEQLVTELEKLDLSSGQDNIMIRLLNRFIPNRSGGSSAAFQTGYGFA